MKYLTPFRISTYLLLLFFAGHTGGGMLAQKSMGPQADAVFTAMKSVEFDFNGSTSTWYGFWFGFGLMCSVFLAFSALMAWQLDKVPPAAWSHVKLMAWALVVSQALNAFLSFRYFFIGPASFATLVTLLMGAGCLMKQRGAAAG